MHRVALGATLPPLAFAFDIVRRATAASHAELTWSVLGWRLDTRLQGTPSGAARAEDA